MSNTRNICTSLSKGLSNLKETISLRQEESTKLILPIVLTTASATLLALPSAASAVFADSLLPAYVVRGLVVGSLIGIANVVASRFRHESKPDDKLLESNKKNYASLVTLEGKITSKVSKEWLPVLKKAFQDNNSAGVVLQINSTGGSPVQSSIIYNEIKKLKKQYKKRVIAVGEDHLTSGAYYIASSADVIYANPNTVTGSIGVIASNYGFTELAKKIGIDDRTHTAGPLKNRSSLLAPESKEDAEKIEEVLKQVHEDFMSVVIATRKDKLKEPNDKLFSGDYWTGKKALELGLVDRLGNLSEVLENEFGVDKYKEYESTSVFKSIFSKIEQLDVSLSLDQDKPSVKLTV